MIPWGMAELDAMPWADFCAEWIEAESIGTPHGN